MFNNNRLRLLIIILLIAIPNYINPIKFKFKDINDKDHIIKAVFDTGFSIKAVSDALGITDYETFFTRSAFFYDDFGIGFNLEFRFRFFLGQVGYYSYLDNQTTAFRYLDWYIPEGYMLNSGLNTLFLYLDKIDYIVYGNLKSPFYFHLGKNQYTTFGAGFLVKDFHNQAFLPVAKEQGIFFRFDGNQLEKINFNNIPVDMSFLMNDLFDPDIFAYDVGVNVMQFTKYKDIYKLRVGATFAVDINSTESNRLSSQRAEDVTSYRNLSTTTNNLYTSFPLFATASSIFEWGNNFVKLIQSDEIGMLLDFNSNYPSTKAGFGIKAHIDARFINLENSGFLLGISTGAILESPHYFMDYFSSNYEILRKKQYLALNNNNDYTFYIMAGFGLYGFNEKIKFEFNMTIPLIKQFCSRFTIKFTMEDTVVPGLFFSALYETGVNAIYVLGNGSGIIDSITRDFRFAFEAGYNFFGAKLSVVIGVQRPWYAVPRANEDEIYTKDPFDELAQGNIVPTTGNSAKKYNWYSVDMDSFSKEIEKFVSVEISFVF